jgi:hypothetical protein
MERAHNGAYLARAVLSHRDTRDPLTELGLGLASFFPDFPLTLIASGHQTTGLGGVYFDAALE